MAKDESGKEEYNAQEEALRYGTVRTNALFDRGPSSFKFSRAGGLVQVRIPWVTIWWGGSFGLLGMIIGGLIFFKIFQMPMIYLPIIFVACGVVPGFLGAKLGAWSPMQDSTGEDLVTYLIVSLRKKVSANSAQSGEQSECKLVSYALSDDGQVVNCKRWIGTQPLYSAPPQSLYEEDDFRTPLYFYPTGEQKTYDNSGYRDDATTN